MEARGRESATDRVSPRRLRQTRGKFGLGAKMALIWSKKSTGLPITIRSAHSTDKDTPPAHVSHYELDIDIHKNEPVVLQERKVPFAQAQAEEASATHM